LFKKKKKKKGKSREGYRVLVAFGPIHLFI
jgi:hypothetical protein